MAHSSIRATLVLLALGAASLAPAGSAIDSQYVCAGGPGYCTSVACIYKDGEDTCTPENWNCKGVFLDGELYWVCGPPNGG